ncbi:MAG: hypothetical protein ACM3JC_14180 [Rudaea sp.]
MKPLYDFLCRQDPESVERCQALAVVVLIVVLGLFAGVAFAR